MDDCLETNFTQIKMCDQANEGNTSNIEYYEDYNTYVNKMKEKRQRVIEDFVNDQRFDPKEKTIKILEVEYAYLEKQQQALFYSNEEMFKYGPNDVEMIECRAENLKFIEKNYKRMKEIKNDLLKLDGEENYIVKKNIYEQIKFEDKIDIDIDVDIENECNLEDGDKNINKNEIINEIDL
jgi:hypothetical protein